MVNSSIPDGRLHAKGGAGRPLPTHTESSTSEGLHVVPLNEITVVDFGETFAKVIAMKISADQRYVLVEGPRKSPQDSVDEGGMYRDAQAEQTDPPQPLQGLDSP